MHNPFTLFGRMAFALLLMSGAFAALPAITQHSSASAPATLLVATR